jgi:hypothetical protein
VYSSTYVACTNVATGYSRTVLVLYTTTLLLQYYSIAVVL